MDYISKTNNTHHKKDHKLPDTNTAEFPIDSMKLWIIGVCLNSNSCISDNGRGTTCN